MLGDYVQNTAGIIGKVIGIKPTEIIMQYHDNSTCFSDPKLLEPIPLTPEILEKNGFKPGRISWIFWDEETDECLIVLKRINNAFIFPPLAGISFGIQYVHELQHLFRLGGIKKEIII